MDAIKTHKKILKGAHNATSFKIILGNTVVIISRQDCTLNLQQNSTQQEIMDAGVKHLKVRISII